MDKINLPNNIFFTGVPGSKWSGVAQELECDSNFNTTDQNSDREYKVAHYSGHRGAYFGTGMEFEANCSFTDQAYADPTAGTKIVKSHEWAHDLKGIYVYRTCKQGDWIMLVYRPDMASYAWWFEAGGFQITYPKYEYYMDSQFMLQEIQLQNKRILDFASDHDCTWNYFTPKWVKQEFGIDMQFDFNAKDVLVALVKPNV